MNAFLRIFWKESRAQWHVWIALALGILLLQGALASSELSRQPSMTPGAVAALFMISSVVGICYAATSAAILIAGEREDETAFLLRTFPVPRHSLVGGKLSFTLVSLVALVSLGFASAALLGGAFSRSSVALPADLWTYSRSMGGAIAWGFLFSLLVDRVMIALGLAIATEIVVVGIIGNFLPEALREPVYWAIVFLVLVADLFLASRWLRGEPLVSPLRWQSSAVAPKVKRSTPWLRLLQRIVASGSPERRATGALLWRELRGAVPFAAVWSVVGIVMVDLAMRTRDKFPAHFAFLALTPAVCGLMTALGDQRKSVFRFFTDRGISPLRIWLVKIATWLLLATAILVLFGWYGETFSSRFDKTLNPPVWSVVHGIERTVRPPLERTDLAATAEATQLQWNFLLSLGLMLFVIGQWAAFLRRQAVVAAAMTFGLGLLAIGWHYMMVFLDVPLLLSTWPLSLAGLAATAWNSPRWLLEDRRWRTRIGRGAWFALPVVAVILATRTWRILSIPVVASPLVPLPDQIPPLPVRNSVAIAFHNPEVARILVQSPGDVIRPMETHPGGEVATLMKIVRAAKTLVTPELPPAPSEMLDPLQLPQEPLEMPVGGSPLNLLSPPATPAPGGSVPPSGPAPVDPPSAPSALPLPTPVDAVQEDAPPSDPPSSGPRPGPAPVDPPSAAPLPVLPTPADPVEGAEAGAPAAGGGTVPSARPPAAPEPIDPVTLGARWDGLAELIAAADRSAEASVDWREWIESVETRQKILQSARQWGRIPGQTRERLDAAIADLRRIRDYPSATPMLLNRHALWHAYLNGTTPGGFYSVIGPRDWGTHVIGLFTGDQARSRRLADVMTAAALQLDRRQSDDPSSIGRHSDDVTEADQRRIGRWLATTTMVPYSFRFEPAADDSERQIIEAHRKNAAAARLGTLVCLMLQRYRLEHGEFPARLEDLWEGQPIERDSHTALLRDPYTGDEFRYRRDGFPGPIRLDITSGSWQEERTNMIPAGTPLLWSAGPSLRGIELHIQGNNRLYVTTANRRPQITIPVAIGDFTGWSADKRVHPEQVEFLVLPP